ncbi:MAG: oxidoreductase [Leptospiraceae bacterium]|nr:MAG: oxidoreductase [Leptospiraceae bacterium]
MNIDNKVVWITGASSGIGRALVKELAKYHCNFILTSRNCDKLIELIQELQYPEEKYLILPFDLMDYKNLPSLVEKAVERFKKIDILINNAGITQRSLAKETAIETTEKIFALDFFAPVYLTKLTLPYFNEPGNITIISSVAGKFGSPYRSTYSAAKHALHGYFDSLRAELHRENKIIQVLIVCPGFVKTNISLNALKGDGTLHNQLDEGIQKGLEPEYVAKKIINAIKKDKQEIIIAGLKESFAVFLKRFFPEILSKILVKAKVT